MRTRDSDNQHYGVEGSIGLIASNLVVTGPIIKNKLSFIAGVRRSYLDLLAIPLSKLTSNNQTVFDYYFQDLNGKLYWKINQEHCVYLSFYNSGDNFYVIEKQKDQEDSATGTISKDKYGLKWGNFIISSGMHNILSKRFQTLTIPDFNRYRFPVYGSEKSEQSINDPFFLEVQDYGIYNQKRLVMHSFFQIIPSISYQFRFH